MDPFEEVPGAAALSGWYGGVPSFHDAEIIDFHVHRSAPSRIRIHAWKMPDRVGEDGQYVLEKHFVASFVLEGVTDLELSGFNHQNVIYGLSIKRDPDGYELILEHCWGLSGSVRARRMSIEFEPGKPR